MSSYNPNILVRSVLSALFAGEGREKKRQRNLPKSIQLVRGRAGLGMQSSSGACAQKAALAFCWSFWNVVLYIYIYIHTHTHTHTHICTYIHIYVYFRIFSLLKCFTSAVHNSGVHSCIQSMSTHIISFQCKDRCYSQRLRAPPFVSLLLCSRCVRLCDPVDCSTPGFPVLHCLPEFAQIHVHWFNDGMSSSVIPFSSCPQSFPASGAFPVNRLFAPGGQSTGASASASVVPLNIRTGCKSSMQSSQPHLGTLLGASSTKQASR